MFWRRACEDPTARAEGPKETWTLQMGPCRPRDTTGRPQIVNPTQHYMSCSPNSLIKGGYIGYIGDYHRGD